MTPIKTFAAAACLALAGLAPLADAQADAFTALQANAAESAQKADNFRRALPQGERLEDLRHRGDAARHGRRAQYNKFALQNAGRSGMQAAQQAGEMARIKRGAGVQRAVAAGDTARDVRQAAKTAKAAKAAKTAKAVRTTGAVVKGAKVGLSATGVGALVVVAEEGLRATTGVDVVTPVVQTAGDLTVGMVRAAKERRLGRHIGQTAVNIPKRLIVDNVKKVHKTFTTKGQVKKNVKKWGCGVGNIFKKKAKKKSC
ncbi:MAG: hypothetical protein AAFR52_02550 [Pseudomonadota bacterium]